MKTNLTFCILALVALFSFVSCSEDGAVTPGSAKDPAGAVIANIGNNSDRYLKVGADGNNSGFYLYCDSSNNISAEGGSIVMVGMGNGLGNIKTSSIPTTGWADKATALEGYLYILRFERNKKIYYFGLQVVNTRTSSSDHGIIGYTVKYCQFSLEDGWL